MYTVWHRGLTCKLLRLLPDRHMVYMIMEMVGNRSFTLSTENSLLKKKNSTRLGQFRESTGYEEVSMVRPS